MLTQLRGYDTMRLCPYSDIAYQQKRPANRSDPAGWANPQGRVRRLGGLVRFYHNMVNSTAPSHPAVGRFFHSGGVDHAILGAEQVRTLRRIYRANGDGTPAAVLFGKLQTGGLPCYETRQNGPEAKRGINRTRGGTASAGYQGGDAVTRLPGVPDETIVDVIPAGQLAHAGILQAVPVVQVNWFDERAGCVVGHRYDGGEIAGTPAEYEGCRFYAAGGCRMNGNPSRDGCLFHMAESTQPWERLRRFALLRLPEGGYALTSRASAVEIAADLGAVIVDAVKVEVTR